MSNEDTTSGQAAANVAAEKEGRRWLLPASLAAFVLILAGQIIQASGASNADDDAGRLVDRVDEFGRVLAGSITQGLGFILFAVPLLFLFRAAQNRGAPVRPGLRPLVVLGPVLIAISLVLSAFAFDSIANDFVDGGVTSGEEAEERAEDLIAESTLFQISGFMGIAGLLSFGFGGLYTAMQAMRVGLLSRFWGTLGMALSVFVGLSPFFGSLGLLGMIMWVVVVSLQIVDRWPGGRPPAWETGRAMPWPKPGEAPPPSGDEPEELARPEDFEGTGSEVDTAAERPARRDNKRKRKRKAR